MKKLLTVALIATLYASTGCKEKPKEHVVANSVVAREEVVLTGQLFVVTKGRANVVLGDEKVMLVEEDKLLTYVKSKALEWSNALALAQDRVNEASVNFSNRRRDLEPDLRRFEEAEKYHAAQKELAMEDMKASKTFADVNTAAAKAKAELEWDYKMKTKLGDLKKQAKDAEEPVRGALEAQSSLWDKINWPTVDDLRDVEGKTVTTDADGRFKFILSATAKPVLLIAKANRAVSGDTEKYWWAKRAYLNERVIEINLSNHDQDQLGMQYYAGKYMMDYGIAMEQAKLQREHQAFLDSLNHE